MKRRKNRIKKLKSRRDIIRYLNRSSAKKPERAYAKVYMDLPDEMLQAIEQEARRMGISPQFLIRKLIEKDLNG